MPCSDSQRMQAPIRLVPSKAKQLSKPIAWIVFSNGRVAVMPEVTMKPTADKVAAPTMNCGTFRSRYLAIANSIIPMTTASTAMPSSVAKRQSHHWPRTGMTSPMSRLPTSHSLSAAAYWM